MWEDGGRWHGRVESPFPAAVSSSSRRACLAALRRRAGRKPLTVVEVPPLAGVAEAAALLGWDKRRIFTYLSRGSFPEPIAALASGRVWRRSDIEAYAAARRRKASRGSKR
jgi:predicted DNA-binding transcriptional regulator AlpA